MERQTNVIIDQPKDPVTDQPSPVNVHLKAIDGSVLQLAPVTSLLGGGGGGEYAALTNSLRTMAPQVAANLDMIVLQQLLEKNNIMDASTFQQAVVAPIQQYQVQSHLLATINRLNLPPEKKSGIFSQSANIASRSWKNGLNRFLNKL